MKLPRRAHRTALTAVLLLASTALLLLPGVGSVQAQSYHYEPVPGRTVGIWTDSWASGQLAVFKHHYGFNAALVTPYAKDYDSARAAGFPPSALMMDVVADHYQYVVQQYEAGWYYIDEATEHDCWGRASSGAPLFSPTQLASRRDFIRQTRPGAQFATSGYKRCSHLKGAGPSVDIMMYASYQHWKKLTFSLCSPNLGWGDKREAGWYTSGGDQRPSWTDMRSTFGAKFSMTWVHGGGDEYDILLGHARNLGLNGVWVYHEGPIPANKMEEFLAAAVKHGWLQRVDGPAKRVEYASQSAALVNRQDVSVAWNTAWEIDIQKFVLERRSAASGDFAVVPVLEAQGMGTTLTPHSYGLTEVGVPIGQWQYRVVGISSDGARFPSDPVSVTVSGGIVADRPDSPLLGVGNYPNPFNPSTEIRFYLPSETAADGQKGTPGSAWVTLKVYDLLGREVAVLVDEKKDPGTYSVTFNGAGLASGVYVYRLTAGSTTMTKRMLLTK